MSFVSVDEELLIQLLSVACSARRYCMAWVTPVTSLERDLLEQCDSLYKMAGMVTVSKAAETTEMMHAWRKLARARGMLMNLHRWRKRPEEDPYKLIEEAKTILGDEADL